MTLQYAYKQMSVSFVLVIYIVGPSRPAFYIWELSPKSRNHMYIYNESLASKKPHFSSAESDSESVF